MADIFGGIMDSFKGFSSDLGEFFQSIDLDISNKTNLLDLTGAFVETRNQTLNEEATLGSYTRSGTVSTSLPGVARSSQGATISSQDYLSHMKQWRNRLSEFTELESLGSAGSVNINKLTRGS